MSLNDSSNYAMEYGMDFIKRTFLRMRRNVVALLTHMLRLRDYEAKNKVVFSISIRNFS
jgi:hypothetical protein